MGDYASIDEVRSMNSMEDVADETIEEAISFAETLIDWETGTSWVYKDFSVTVSGQGSRSILLVTDLGRPVMFPQTVVTATVDGVSVDHSNWVLYPEATIIAPGFAFKKKEGGRNVVITGTAGASVAPPDDIKWIARTLARQYVFDLDSRLPDRATAVQSADGTIQISQASAHPNKPTSLPEVNARLVRRRQLVPGVIFS